MINQFTDLFSKITTGELLLKPSEWAEKKVVLTSDVSALPGKFKYNITPYMREIVDTFYQYHDAKIITLMAGAQLGKTQGLIVNAICYSIDVDPGAILSLSRDDRLSAEFVESRLDPAIRSSGIQHKIRPNIIRKRNSRSGDTSKSKEYAGGRAFFGGMQSIKGLVLQRSIKTLFADDWDSAPVSDKEEGNTFSLLQNRFKTFKNEMKQYYISTPKTRPSNIESVFLKGDQREWHVPCPCCGVYIVLEWVDSDKREHGIVWKVDSKGKLIESSIVYRCQECGGEFNEGHKYEINLQGKWVAMAEPEQQGIYSYHISSIYAPPHAYGWKEMVYEWLDIFDQGNESQSKKKSFYNQTLGIPWEEKQEQIKENALVYNTRPEYDIGSIPMSLSNKDGNGNIVLLTCACDLNGTLDDARLDYDVWAHAANGSIYSIDAGSIGTFQPGRKPDHRAKWTYRHGAADNVWDMFENIIKKKYLYADTADFFKILLVGVDVGYYDKYAWEFINKHLNLCVGLQGSPSKYTKAGGNVKIVKKSVNVSNLFLLESNLLKDVLAGMINLEWKDNKKPQPEGFMNFPNPGQNKYSPKGYFAQYEAEHKILQENDMGDATGWKWEKKQGTQNHFFDVACYNMACRYIFLEKYLKAAKIKDGTWSDYADAISSIL